MTTNIENKMIIPEFIKNIEEKVEENKMGAVEREKFMSVVEAMSDEEKLLVIKAAPYEMLLEELGQRLAATTEILNNIRGVLEG